MAEAGPPSPFASVSSSTPEQYDGARHEGSRMVDDPVERRVREGLPPPQRSLRRGRLAVADYMDQAGGVRLGFRTR
jgi:hypothetical protein